MTKTLILGASGYSGAQLVSLLAQHPNFLLPKLGVSASSHDAGKRLADLYPHLQGLPEGQLQLQALDDGALVEVAQSLDAVFLATPHEASHHQVPLLLEQGVKVFDLSGAYRLQDEQVFSKAYGFCHEHLSVLKQAQYGLVDWYPDAIAKADLVAVPGCYPTASLLAIKPVVEAGLLDAGQWPVVNAVSGVSGAGRKASLNTSFCEVSLQAYGVLSHRHQPEISAYAQTPVIFTPHLGNFKRGILATVVMKTQGASQADIDQAFASAYQNNPLVRLKNTSPRIDDIASSPFCDLYWQFDPHSQHLVVVSAIDNLVKGAAGQALQCANLVFGFAPETGLLSGGRNAALSY